MTKRWSASAAEYSHTGSDPLRVTSLEWSLPGAFHPLGLLTHICQSHAPDHMRPVVNSADHLKYNVFILAFRQPQLHLQIDHIHFTRKSNGAAAQREAQEDVVHHGGAARSAWEGCAYTHPPNRLVRRRCYFMRCQSGRWRNFNFPICIATQTTQTLPLILLAHVDNSTDSS